MAQLYTKKITTWMKIDTNGVSYRNQLTIRRTDEQVSVRLNNDKAGIGLGTN